MSEPRTQKPMGTETNDRQVNWEELAPKAVGYEDSMSPEKVATVWETMMKLAGIRQPDEKTRASFRLAVYAYGAQNGTSREGNYAGQMQLSNGTVVEASVIPRAAGKMMIRKFFRGNMAESYTALKASKVIERDERMVARAAKLGISAGSAFAMADWMTDCALFTPEEIVAHERSFNNSVSRARRARGGRDLESVEAQRVNESLEVQGALEHNTSDSGRYSAF